MKIYTILKNRNKNNTEVLVEFVESYLSSTKATERVFELDEQYFSEDHPMEYYYSIIETEIKDTCYYLPQLPD